MTTPAGWYPDNVTPGNERYWDGAQWTDQSRPMAGQPVPPPPPPPVAPAQPMPLPAQATSQKNWFLRHKVLTGIAAVLAIGIIGSAAGSGSTDDKSNDASNDTPVVTETESPAAQAPASQAPKPVATKAAVKPAAPSLTYPGKKDGDKAVKPGGTVELSGWSTTISALTKKTEQYIGDYLCANVLMVNRDDETQATGQITMQAPNGQVEDATFIGSGDSRYESFQDVAPGGRVESVVCFDYKKTFGAGQFLVSWQPDTFSSEDRGVWVNAR